MDHVGYEDDEENLPLIIQILNILFERYGGKIVRAGGFEDRRAREIWDALIRYFQNILSIITTDNYSRQIINLFFTRITDAINLYIRNIKTDALELLLNDLKGLKRK